MLESFHNNHIAEDRHRVAMLGAATRADILLGNLGGYKGRTYLFFAE